jgi:hypothetical protein
MRTVAVHSLSNTVELRLRYLLALVRLATLRE